MRHRPYALRSAGFTLVEMLMVVVILLVLTLVAYPALSTFTARDSGLQSASATARLINKVRATARQQNLAYVVTFTGFSAAQPLGVVEIRRGNSNSCAAVTANVANNSVLVKRSLFGQQPPPDNTPVNDSSDTVSQVGLSGWLQSSDAVGAQLRNNNLVLCVKTDGALIDAATLAPLAGVTRLKVQRFEGVPGGGWRQAEPARTLDLTFAGQTHLELN
jgi:prepilin-type N-terminal cleavage/methylation domain-containing protein